MRVPSTQVHCSHSSFTNAIFEDNLAKWSRESSQEEGIEEQEELELTKIKITILGERDRKIERESNSN